MKRPYLNQQERFHVRMNTLRGQGLLLSLSLKKVKRELHRAGFCTIKFAIIASLLWMLIRGVIELIRPGG